MVRVVARAMNIYILYFQRTSAVSQWCLLTVSPTLLGIQYFEVRASTSGKSYWVDLIAPAVVDGTQDNID